MTNWPPLTGTCCRSVCSPERSNHSMRLIVTKDYMAMSRCAARMVAEMLASHPAATIAIPTGETPAGFYRELAALHRLGAFDASHLRVFQLDEYLGVAPDDPRAFAGWIARAILDPLDISPAQVVRLHGEASDLYAACQQYDAAVAAAGGFDIAVLGLGANGHIAFNEPPTDPESPTRVVRLSDETRASNARYWGEQTHVPEHAVTCGMANILAARVKLLLVAGERKRDILRRVVDGPISPGVPASLLAASDGVTIIADEAAWPGSVPTIAALSPSSLSSRLECGDH
jgi:glucosamine-6-phosphate deaminase